MTENTESGGWWTGLISTVTSASTNIINVYKEELSEFSRSIQEDTKQVVSKQLQNIKEETSVVLNLLGSAPSATEENKPQAQKTEVDPRLLYTTDPTDTEDYKKWLKTFDIKEKTEEISQLLSSNDTLKTIHKDLVPASVSYSDFWRRYYYKLQKEQRRAALLERAQHQNEEEIGWDDDEDLGIPTNPSLDQNPPLTSQQTTTSPPSDSPVSSQPEPTVVEPLETVITVSAGAAPPSPKISETRPPSENPSVAPTVPESDEKQQKEGKEEEWADWE